MSNTLKKIVYSTLGIYITFCILLLVWVVVYSGSGDGDTLEHVHSSWLIYSKKVPYKDFFQHHNPLLWYLAAPVVGDPNAGEISLGPLDDASLDLHNFLGAVAKANVVAHRCQNQCAGRIGTNHTMVIIQQIIRAAGAKAVIDDSLGAILHAHSFFQHGVILAGNGDGRTAGEERMTVEKDLAGLYRHSFVFFDAILKASYFQSRTKHSSAPHFR